MKELLARFPDQFLRLAAPEIAERIDLASVAFEPEEHYPGSPTGRERRPDLVSRASTRVGEDGEDEGEVLVHVMETLGYSPDKKLAVTNLLDELAQEHRIQIVDLMAHKIIPADPQRFFLALGFAPLEIENLLRQFSEGKSLEEAARPYGYPDDEIDRAKRLVDCRSSSWSSRFFSQSVAVAPAL